MTAPGSFLRSLLPGLYWHRPSSAGPLDALLAAIEEQYLDLHADVATMYDDVFLETCQQRLVPYFGDELGVAGFADFEAPGLSLRSWVGRAIAFRRRKGTLPTVARATIAATGWSVYALDGRAVMARTQALDHLALDQGRSVDLGDGAALAALRAPWSTTARTAGISDAPTRRAGDPFPAVGPWPQPGRVHLSIWRTRAFPFTQREAAPVAVPGVPHGRAFTISPFGVDTALHLLPVDGTADRAPTPAELPLALSRHALAQRLADASQAAPITVHWVGDDGSTVLPPGLIASGDLSRWEAPAGLAEVVIDPELGRILCTEATPSRLLVDGSSGGVADIGGGPYAVDGQWRVPPPDVRLVRLGGLDPHHDTLAAALADIESHGGDGVLRIEDSRRYHADGDRLTVAAGTAVAITTLPGASPTIVGNLVLHLADSGRVDITGLGIAGGLVLSGRGTCAIEHSTIWTEGGPALHLVADGTLAVTLSSVVVGSVAAHGPVQLALVDSIVDGALGMEGAPVPMLDVRTSTVLGRTRAGTLVGETSIFAGSVTTARTDEGVLLHCATPADGAPPVFTSTRFGSSAYCQLAPSCPPAISVGGGLGSELGAYHALQQPARAARLPALLTTFLPAGQSATVSVRT